MEAHREELHTLPMEELMADLGFEGWIGVHQEEKEVNVMVEVQEKRETVEYVAWGTGWCGRGRVEGRGREKGAGF